MSGRDLPEPTELVYLPGPSWVPVLMATGLVGVGVGLFAGWPYAIVGAVLVLASLRSWIRASGDEISRLPREQRLTSAVLPAVPLRSRDESETVGG
jgi:hypothetical protein